MNDNIKNQSQEIDEVTNLNVSDLDVQELEHRLELAAAADPANAGWICGNDFSTN